MSRVSWISGLSISTSAPRPALIFVLAAVFSACAIAADADGDGLDDAWEEEHGFTAGRTTRVVYLDEENGSDANGGLSPSSAKRTFAGALAVQRNAAEENVILVAPGVYSGTQNRGLDFVITTFFDKRLH